MIAKICYFFLATKQIKKKKGKKAKEKKAPLYGVLYIV